MNHSQPTPRAVAILPAYNEAARISGVLQAVTQASGIDEILVVTDGCSDNTAAVAREFASGLHSDQSPVRVFELPTNIGKGGAMTYGAHRTDAEILLFLDADLGGLKPEQVEAMIAPMRCENVEERADMVLGLFGAVEGDNLWRGGFGWFLGMCHRNAASITGQRAIRRDAFLAVPDLTKSRFGVETAITRYVAHIWQMRVEHVSLPGVTHPIKEQKCGVWKGLRHRAAMYSEIATYLALDTARHYAHTRYRRQAQRLREWFSDDHL